MNGPKAASFTLHFGTAFIDYSLFITFYSILWKLVPLMVVLIGMQLVTNFTIYFVYFVGMTRKLGSKLGAYALGLVIVDRKSGERIGYNRCAARSFYMLLPLTPFLCYFYIFYSYMLSSRYEYREGSQRLWQKIQAHEIFTEAETKRWHDFVIYAKEPIEQMAAVAFLLTFAAIFIGGVAMALSPRRQSIYDRVGQTLVISKKNAR